MFEEKLTLETGTPVGAYDHGYYQPEWQRIAIKDIEEDRVYLVDAGYGNLAWLKGRWIKRYAQVRGYKDTGKISVEPQKSLHEYDIAYMPSIRLPLSAADFVKREDQP